MKQRRLQRRSAPGWARAAPSGELQAAAAAVRQADVDRLSSPQDASASSNGSNGTHTDAFSSSNGAHAPELCSPEDLVLEPGELSHIDRSHPLDSADVFRCSGCLIEACQGPSGCAKMLWRDQPGGYLKEILTARVYDVAVESQLELAKGLSQSLNNRLFLKREDLQPVFSFKLRGAYNKMASLTAEQRERGVITSSAGNHAQGVSLAASRLGCKATICMPTSTPGIKIDAVRRLGGIVELVGETYSETQTYAQAKSAETGMVFIPPYDDPYIISGQGTVGTELLRQLSTPDLDKLHAIFVAIGGGGLAAGIAAYVKALRPGVKIYGVEPSGANAMALSLMKGKRVTLSKVDAFADGVAVKQVGMETFRMCRSLLDGVILVDNSAISAAIKDVFNETRSILEPAGAVAVAGAKAYLSRHGLKGVSAVAVTSGANMNFDRLRLVTELAGIGALKEAMLATTMPERQGSFKDFLDIALDNSDLQITEFKYRFSAAAEAHVLWGLGIRHPSEVAKLEERLTTAGFPTIDISGIEAAQIHLRHLVGGRARSYTGELPHERIFQVDFPERPGALRKFLGVFSPDFLLTLFHYRKTGNRSTKLLIGMQVPPMEEEKFQRAVDALADNYTFEELSGKARQVFGMFIS
ncbi:g2410 [Coccomyxa viridis]|uniref:Threonine dehydratase n=1 Tax=Coccomyxa viridis TaxID=1274662 RepID=A0ABP1FNA9_9CHLO